MQHFLLMNLVYTTEVRVQQNRLRLSDVRRGVCALTQTIRYRRHNDGVIDIMQEQEQEEPNNSTDHRPINPNPLQVVTCLLLNKLVEILICVRCEGLSDHASNQVMFILNHPA